MSRSLWMAGSRGGAKNARACQAAADQRRQSSRTRTGPEGDRAHDAWHQNGVRRVAGRLGSPSGARSCPMLPPSSESYRAVTAIVRGGMLFWHQWRLPGCLGVGRQTAHKPARNAIGAQRYLTTHSPFPVPRSVGFGGDTRQSTGPAAPWLEGGESGLRTPKRSRVLHLLRPIGRGQRWVAGCIDPRRPSDLAITRASFAPTRHRPLVIAQLVPGFSTLSGAKQITKLPPHARLFSGRERLLPSLACPSPTRPVIVAAQSRYPR